VKTYVSLIGYKKKGAWRMDPYKYFIVITLIPNYSANVLILILLATIFAAGRFYIIDIYKFWSLNFTTGF
jgi:hypothetical protein